MADHVNCREIRVHVIWKFWRKYLDWAGNIRCHMKICLSKILFLWSLIDNKELNWCIFAQRGNVFWKSPYFADTYLRKTFPKVHIFWRGYILLHFVASILPHLPSWELSWTENIKRRLQRNIFTTREEIFPSEETIYLC